MDRHFGKRYCLPGELFNDQSLVVVSSFAHEFLRFVPVIILAVEGLANGNTFDQQFLAYLPAFPAYLEHLTLNGDFGVALRIVPSCLGVILVYSDVTQKRRYRNGDKK